MCGKPPAYPAPHAKELALPRADAYDSIMSGTGTVGCHGLPQRRRQMPLCRSCRSQERRAGRFLPSSARLPPPSLFGLALVGALVRVVQAQSPQDMTWAGGYDPWARTRTSAAKFIGLVFALEVLLWILVYGWKHARDQYHKPMVELRANVRLKHIFDLEAERRDQHSRLKAAGDTHEMYLRLRREAEAEQHNLSPRFGGGNAKGTAPYNPHKQFKRDARSGNVSAFTAWQREEEEHRHHELLLDGRRAALV